MADRKLRLNLEALRIKSFETSPGSGLQKGTVHGHQEPCGTCTFCTNCTGWTLCPASCNAFSGWNMSTSEDGNGC